VDKKPYLRPHRQLWLGQPGGCCITNNKQTDPLFLSPSGLDWHILVSSPAIGFSNLSYIQSVDKDGVSRASSPAAGAYQY